MNKKFIGIAIGIIILVIIIIGVQLYKSVETSPNSSNAPPPTTIPQKPTNTGRNIVVELNESLSVISH